MKTKINILTFIVAVAVLFFGNAFAADAPACSKDQISIGTGISGGTYSNMFKSIKGVAGDMVCEYQKTGGGYDNILLLMDRKIDAGIVQADVFDFLNKTNPDIRKKLRNLFSMHGSSMHIFVLKDGTKVKGKPGKLGTSFGGTPDEIVKISTLRDLRGRKVAAFSSAFVTATVIDPILKLDMEIVETGKDEGFAKLKNGEVFAFLAMGGKPIEWIDKVDEKVFALANVETSDINALQAPFYNTKLQYKKLGAIGTNSITARNDLVVWDYAGKKASTLLKIRDLVRENLADIKEDMDAHACWQEVDEKSFDDTFWQRYNPSVKQEVAEVKPEPVAVKQDSVVVPATTKKTTNKR